MGCVVFNYKRCDFAKDCPAISSCAAELGKSTGAVRYDEKTKTIVVDEDVCKNHKCISKACTKDCADCFSYADTPVEYWWEVEQVRETVFDPNYRKKDRYNSEDILDFAKLTVDNFENYLKETDCLVVLEITSSSGCCSAYSSIPILDLIPEYIYHQYYKKIVVYTETEVDYLERFFELNELPALLFILQKKIIGRVVGIYQNSSDEDVCTMKNKVKEILDVILGLID